MLGHVAGSCWVQTVRDQHKASYTEAVKGVDMEQGFGGVKVNSTEMWSQPPLPTLPAFPPDMMILNRDSILAFISDVLVGAKTTTRRSDFIVIR